ncbi:MAG: SDR family NAD(P)-dependent oxidoreductase, partial [Limosilactobacillus sp.]
MTKKIILITGASSGIGKETAIQLAKQGHTIIMHGRDLAKTRQAVSEVIAASNNQQVTMVTADLSLMAEVQQLADTLKSRYQHLDVLINNAGAQFAGARKVTSEGHERTFAINTLAPFLLTNLLLPLLAKSTAGRVVTVSSESYKLGGPVDWDDVEFKKDYSLTRSYGLTKRYVLWLMLALAKRLPAQGIANVTVNVCEPGS